MDLLREARPPSSSPPWSSSCRGSVPRAAGLTTSSTSPGTCTTAAPIRRAAFQSTKILRRIARYPQHPEQAGGDFTH
ncbi:hypothetical protein J4Q44_G00113060 [Coregonus suidteri]|uniref:Uncharacterized protein n=1 Tax=Coregonus suidteri TaxID=861788 RepID=A0AAN8LTL3_9TELE